MADAKQGPKMERDFSRVILTLENVLIPDDKLSPTPSMQDGLDSESEIDLRILGCEMIQTSGILLKLPQVKNVLFLKTSINNSISFVIRYLFQVNKDYIEISFSFQVAMATGQVLFQRFFYSKSFVKHNMEVSVLKLVT